MKILQGILSGVLLSAALGFNAVAHAQTIIAEESALESIQRVPQGTEPLIGTYYRMSDIVNMPGESPFAGPPYPGQPSGTAGAPVYAVDGGLGVYIVDDTVLSGSALSSTQVSAEIVQARILNLVQTVQQAAADRELSLSASATMSADGIDGEMLTMDAGGLSLAEMYSSEDLWLSIEGVHDGVAEMTLHNTQATNVYMLAGCTDLAASVWLPQKALHPSTNSSDIASAILILNRPENMFFRAKTWNETTPLGVPQWWLFTHFGVTNVPSGYTEEDLLAAYQTGGNPNSVSFRLTLTNEYSATASMPVTIETVTGYPTAVAVLTDETNQALASWNSFSSTVQADLGSVEGWHTIYVGVRGSSDYPETWEQVRVKLDQTPPQIVVDTPSESVSQPMIQVNGFSPESLSSLSCYLTNAAGISSQELISVLRQVYDSNVRELTTNFFQAYDLPLANGLNILTIRATDWAGNLMVTNFNFALTNDSIPPVISLGYPSDGMAVADGVLTISGILDDASAKISATLVSTNGTTNTVAGLIERDGKFWIENAALSGGTNWITVQATDAWGNVSTTNFVVVKSDFNISINPVSDEELTHTQVTVSGTVSDPSYSVRVNDLEAVVNSDGSWSVDNVPVTEGGTASFFVSAYPPQAAQASSASGTGSAAASSSSPSNPVNANTNQVKGSYIIVLDYHNDVSMAITPHNYSPKGLWYNETHLKWALNKNATRHAVGIQQTNVDGGNQTFTSDTTWPPDDYPPTKLGTRVSVPGGTTYGEPAPIIGQEHCEVSGKFPIPQTIATNTYSRSAQTTMQLFTGGKKLPQRNNLFAVRGSATRVLTKTAQPPYPSGTELEPIADKTKITMGELGALDSSGVVWAVLPNGETKDVTPKVSGVDFYAFGADHTKYVLTNSCERGAPRPADRTDLGVGEYVSVQFNPSPAGVPIAWSTTGGGVIPVTGSGTRFTAPSNAASATVTATVKGLKCSVDFNVLAPSGIDHTDFVEYWPYSSTTLAGAGMHIRPYVGPMNVSFYRITLMEVGRDASDIKGYFTVVHAPPSHIGNGADTPIPINDDNSWDWGWDNARSSGWAAPWSASGNPGFSGGSYTWQIPATWQIGAGLVHPMTGWDQVHTLSANGTMTVTKLGHSVSRTIQGVYSGQ